MNTNFYPCPCCGYLVFEESPGSYDICPICFWGDDLSQLRFPTSSGANTPNLIEAQLNCLNFGVKMPGYKRRIEPPVPFNREENWRIIDLKIDNVELSSVGNQSRTYPKDMTTLYYWRDTYWRGQQAAK